MRGWTFCWGNKNLVGESAGGRFFLMGGEGSKFLASEGLLSIPSVTKTLRRECKQCLLLLKYGSCSNNALYLASLSFIITVFLLPPFNIWDCYYFKSNLILVLIIKMFFTKKTCNVVLRFSNHEKITFPHEFIFVFIMYFFGVILSKTIVKKEGFRKR